MAYRHIKSGLDNLIISDNRRIPKCPTYKPDGPLCPTNVLIIYSFVTPSMRIPISYLQSKEGTILPEPGYIGPHHCSSLNSASDEHLIYNIVNFRVISTGFYMSLSRACIPNPPPPPQNMTCVGVVHIDRAYIDSSFSVAYASVAASYREAQAYSAPAGLVEVDLQASI